MTTVSIPQPVVLASVWTSAFGGRSISADLSGVQNLAKTVANSTISNVNAVMDAFEGTGDSALDAAIDAIGLLRDFQPTNVSVSQFIPAFTTPYYTLPQAFDGVDVSSLASISDIPELGFSFPPVDYQAVQRKTINRPDPIDLTFDDAPQIDFAFTQPTDPSNIDWTDPVAYVPPTDPSQGGSLVPPAISFYDISGGDELVIAEGMQFGSAVPLSIDSPVPVSVPPPSPIGDFDQANEELQAVGEVIDGYTFDVEELDISALEAEINELIGFDLEGFEFTPLPKLGAGVMPIMVDVWEDVLLLDDHSLFRKIQAEQGIELPHGESGPGPQVPTWASLGFAIPGTADTAVIDARNAELDSIVTHSDMQAEINYKNASEDAMYTHYEQFRTRREYNDAVAELDKRASILKQAVEQKYIPALQTAAQAARDTYGLAVALYRIRAQQHAIQIIALRSQYDVWAARLQTVTASVETRGGYADAFDAQVEAAIAEAPLYRFQLINLRQQETLYRAELDRFSTYQELLRTRNETFQLDVDKYKAELQQYSARYDEQIARLRATAAQNDAALLSVEMSETELAAARADIRNITADLEAEATQLQAQAEEIGIDYDALRLKNTIAAIKPRIALAEQRIAIRESAQLYASNRAYNDYSADFNQAAARFFGQASESVFRTSDAGSRAMLASSENLLSAQEAAARTAASLAQGAYSAISVSASLTGSGGISASESVNGSQRLQIGDYLQFRDSVSQDLSG